MNTIELMFATEEGYFSHYVKSYQTAYDILIQFKNMNIPAWVML